ncbi:hypothetical protein EV128_13430 [Rhizobium azibense]|nr:hypothetical protein EV128_13430 [Rhizobium azibense]
MASLFQGRNPISKLQPKTEKPSIATEATNGSRVIPPKALQSAVPISNAQRVQNLVFPVTAKLDTHEIDIGRNKQLLPPGTVEIKTGSAAF